MATAPPRRAPPARRPASAAAACARRRFEPRADPEHAPRTRAPRTRSIRDLPSSVTRSRPPFAQLAADQRHLRAAEAQAGRWRRPRRAHDRVAPRDARHACASSPATASKTPPSRSSTGSSTGSVTIVVRFSARSRRGDAEPVGVTGVAPEVHARGPGACRPSVFQSAWLAPAPSLPCSPRRSSSPRRCRRRPGLPGHQHRAGAPATAGEPAAGQAGSSAPKPDSTLGAVLSRRRARVGAGRIDAQDHGVRAHRVGALRLEARCPRPANVRVARSVGAGGLAADGRARGGRAVLAVDYPALHRHAPVVAGARAAEPEHVRLLKVSNDQQDLVTLVDRWLQPPVRENRQLTSEGQNWDEVDGLRRQLLDGEVAEEPNQSASQVKPFRPRAVVERGRGGRDRRRNAPALVPSQGWVPPTLASSWMPVGRDGAVEDRLGAPSTRRLTETGAASAAVAEAPAMARRNERCPPDRLVIWPPFLEGRMGYDRGQVSWLGAQRRAFPECRRHPSGISDASAPVHSGGTAPASHRTSLDHRPMNGQAYPAASTDLQPPLKSLAATCRHRLGD